MGFVIFLIILLGLIYWFIPAIVGGTITAFAIKSTDTKVDFPRMLTIALGWCLGMFIGGMTGRLVDIALSLFIFTAITTPHSALSLILGLGVAGMITALIGSWTTYRVLASLEQPSENAG
jgi:hypothetical protein